VGGAIFILFLPLAVGARSAWLHADLSGKSLDGANCEGINLFGARLVEEQFLGAQPSQRGTVIQRRNWNNFRGANLDGYLMYRNETKLGQFDVAV